MPGKVFILGGWQTDFARNWFRSGDTLFELMQTAVEGAIAENAIEPREIQVGHVGNFAGELFSGQGHLGGFLASIHPDLSGLPTSRHEAACASGSAAVLAAMADIESGRYDLACVVGVEQMRTVPGEQGAAFLGAAAWVGREAQGARYVWPHMMSRMADEYDTRYGVDQAHLTQIARTNFAHAKRNPNAQTRGWTFRDESFQPNDEHNPIVEGRIRRHDCAQITDGAAVVFLASERFAHEYARRRAAGPGTLATVEGWGHRTAPMLYDRKIEESTGKPFVFPHVRGCIEDAWRRAGISGLDDIDGAEVHDCFTITEYMAIDHLGLTAPGESWKAIEARDIEIGGDLPINPGGGLIGLGHPVGATGVRMLLDGWKQVTARAGDCQVEGARRFQTLNIGGSTTTVVSFVVGRAD
jgi:acetyl-CoA C-acetyltransferase